MKVLQIITSLNTGGAEKLITDSVPIYQEYLNVDVLCLEKKETTFWKSLKKKSNGKISGLSTGSVYNPLLIIKIIPFLKKYDIIHVHLFPALYWVVLAKLLSFSKTPLIYTEHSTNNKRRSITFLKMIDRFIYKRLDFVGSISVGTKINLENHLNNMSDRIKVIPNGIVLSDFETADEKEESFFDSNSFVLIQISSFREQKDQATLIKSLLELPEEIKLLLVGDGPLRSKHEQFAKELNLENRIRFLGIRNDIPSILKGADVCVLSSHYEGFGLAVVEGMAAAKPVVASNVIGLNEIVEGYGLLFERGNSKQLAEQISLLYTDKDFYNKIKELCKKRANNYDIRKMIKSYLDVYERIKKK